MRTWQLLIIAIAAIPLPYCARADQDAKEPTLIVFGRVVWPGLQWFPKGVVSAARDMAFRQIAGNAFVSPEGRFVIALPAGEYYLRAVIDVDADGRLSAGDGIGFYGVKKKTDRPAKLSVKPDAPMEAVVIPIAFQVAEQRKLRRAAVGAAAGTGEIAGRLAGADEQLFIIFWPLESRYAGFAVPVEKDGRFEARLAAGPYWVSAASVGNDEAAVKWVRPVSKSDGAALKQVTVLPQKRIDIGELKADGNEDKGGEKVARLPEGLGLARLEIAAGAPGAEAWQVMLFATEQLDGMMLKAWLWKNVWLALRPATYYILCGADLNGDGMIGIGDAVATARNGGEIGFISVQKGQVVKAAINKIAKVGRVQWMGQRTKQEKQK